MVQDARRSGYHGKKWWRAGRNPSSERVDAADSGAGFVSSTEMCKQLYVEAVERGVPINGKICSAVILGFGSDLAVSGQHAATEFPSKLVEDRTRLYHL